jgi:hypothetical protein
MGNVIGLSLAESENARIILVGIPRRKRSLFRSGCKLDYNFKMDFV